jgi:hypothetical protein
MIVVLVFLYLWILKFTQDSTGFICMYSAVSYYFSSNSQTEGTAKVATGIKLAYSVHAGSIALGSLILTILSIIKSVLQNSKKNAQNS